MCGWPVGPGDKAQVSYLLLMGLKRGPLGLLLVKAPVMPVVPVKAVSFNLHHCIATDGATHLLLICFHVRWGVLC